MPLFRADNNPVEAGIASNPEEYLYRSVINYHWTRKSGLLDVFFGETVEDSFFEADGKSQIENAGLATALTIASINLFCSYDSK